jgi:tRNA (guanine37-N1)-methyltransferase
MYFDILTIFPHILDSYINTSILKRAQKEKVIKIISHDIRKVTTDKHHTVDDNPYGGGVGMVMLVEPIYQTLKKIKRRKKSKVIMLDPAGQPFNQALAKRFSKLDQLIFICGRYEGIDARVDAFIDEKISIGPYVLAGGEMVITEATARLLPGVLGKLESTQQETFAKENYVEHPQYTRPEVFKYRQGLKTKALKVPPVLLSGNHQAIKKWQAENSKTSKISQTS